MDIQIANFIEILEDNSLIAKDYKIPNDIDESFNPLKYEFEVDEMSEVLEFSTKQLLERLEDESILPDDIRYFELNGHRKPMDLDEFLDSGFEEFKNVFASKNYWNEKSLKKEIASQIKVTKNELENLLIEISGIKDITLESLIKVKIEYCFESLRFIKTPIIVVEKQQESKPSKPKKIFENLTSLSQNQVVILFHFLRELKYIGNEMPKNMYAAQVSELTGFATEKIRQDLSNISKDSTSTDKVYFSEFDFSKVRREMEKVVTRLKIETEERFPPKP